MEGSELVIITIDNTGSFRSIKQKNAMVDNYQEELARKNRTDGVKDFWIK